MSISRVKPGDWIGAEALTAAQIEALDNNFYYALDTRSGYEDTAGSTVTWSAGGLTTSSTTAVNVDSTLTVSASSGEVQLYGAGGALSSSNKFPKIQGSTVTLTHFVSVAEFKFSINASYVSPFTTTNPSDGKPYFAQVSVGGTAFAEIPVVHNATISSVKLWLQGYETSATTIIPNNLPTLQVFKVTASTGVATSLYSGTTVLDPSTTRAEYNLYHAITLTPDQNNTNTLIGADYYIARFTGTSALSTGSTRFYGISIDYQVTRFAPVL